MPPRPAPFPRVLPQLAAAAAALRPQCPRCGGFRANNTSLSSSPSSPRRPELPLLSRPSRHQRLFHTTPHTPSPSSSSATGPESGKGAATGSAANLASKNHYDRLGVPPSCPPADIKRSFYRLSKAHHPDANPSDPSASATFSLLSESYTVLSDPGLRAAYDRDVLRLHHHNHHGRHDDGAQRGSYHSAGGRAPSGLSRRRGTFRGPPPSFYRNGAWGAHEGARRRAHEESTGGASHASRPGASDDSSSDNAYHQRRDRGPDPMGYHDEVPHFDKEGHERTQRREDQRRYRRGAAQSDRSEGMRDAFDDGLGAGAQFVIVVGLLAASSLMSMAYYQVTSAAKVSPRKKKDQ